MKHSKKKKKRKKKEKLRIKATNLGVAQALFILSCFAPFRLLSLVLEITSRDASVRRYIDVPSDQPKLPDKICILGCPLSHSDHTKGWYVRQPPKMSEHVKVRKNGQQKTATCFATLLKMS